MSFPSGSHYGCGGLRNARLRRVHSDDKTTYPTEKLENDIHKLEIANFVGVPDTDADWV